MNKIYLLTAGHGAVDSFNGLLPVLAPAIAAHLGADLGDVVMLVGIGSLLTNLIQPVAGQVMARRNLAWTLWFSIMLASLTAFVGFMPNFWALVPLSVLGALGTGLYHPEGVLYAHEVTGEKAYLGIPLFMAGGAAIYALATPLAIRMTEAHGLRSVALFVIPCWILAIIFYREYKGRKRAHPSVIARPRSMRKTKTADSGHMAFRPLLAVGVCSCVGNGLFLAVLSSHFELLFGPDARQWTGWVLMVMGVGASLSSFGWSALSKRYNFYSVVIASQLVAVPLFILMAHPAAARTGFLFALPLSVVTPAAIHPIAVMLSRNAAGSTQGLRSGLMMGGTYAVSAFAVMAAGALIRRGTDSGYLMLFVAGCSATALLLAAWQYLTLRRRGAA